jgi:hypothetical protein
MVRQHKKTVVWFVWSVLFIWLNQINQINLSNQMNQISLSASGLLLAGISLRG